MTHTERANNEAMLHLGQGVMTTSEHEPVHHPHERWLVASDNHNNQGDALSHSFRFASLPDLTPRASTQD